MSFEEEFDKIIKQKAEHAEYPFDKNDWEKAAAMLDAQRGAPALPFWKKFAVPAIIGIAVVSIGIIMLPVNTAKQVSSVSSTNTEALRKEADQNLPAENAPQAEKNVTPVLPSSTETTVNKNNNLTQTTARPKEVKIPSTNPAGADAQSNTANSDSPASAQPLQSDIDEVKISSNISPEVNAPVKANTKRQDDSALSNSDNSSKQNTTESGKVDYANSNIYSAPTQFATESKEENTKVQQSKTGLSFAETISENEQNINAIASDFLPSHALSLALPSDCTFVTANLQALPQMAMPDYVRKQPNFYLALTGGMHYAFGWETATGVDGKGINYFGGIEFGKYIKPDLSLSAGLQYFRFTNIDNPYYASMGKGYGFGYTKKFSSVTVDQLNYISLPINLVYKSKDGIIFGTGFTTNYLAGAHSRVDSYEISDGVKSQTTSIGSQKIYEGTSSLNFMAHVRLGYALSRKFGVYGELQYGLNDMFDSKIKKQNDERSTGLRIGLNYFLIGK